MPVNAPNEQLDLIAPDFELLSVDNNKYSLNSIAGEIGIVIAFICNHCPYVIAIAERLSFEANELKKIGINSSVEDQVKKLASLAKECSLDGIVCSPLELKIVKNICDGMEIFTPRIRAEKSSFDDQKRTMSPKNAIDEGADLLVIGRPITESNDPKNTINKILKNIKNDTKD